MLESLKI